MAQSAMAGSVKCRAKLASDIYHQKKQWEKQQGMAVNFKDLRVILILGPTRLWKKQRCSMGRA
jgi:hypothetical protein